LARTIRIGLPHRNLPGLRARSIRFKAAGSYGVVENLATHGIAKQAGVNKAEMGNVEKVFNDARTQCTEAIRPGEESPEARVLGDGKVGNRTAGFGHRDPDHPVALLNGIGLGVCLGWRGQLRMRRKADTLAGGSILPRMVRADEAIPGGHGCLDILGVRRNRSGHRRG
jgi:hypothetical protein